MQKKKWSKPCVAGLDILQTTGDDLSGGALAALLLSLLGNGSSSGGAPNGNIDS